MTLSVAIDARMIRHSGIGTHIRGLLEGFSRLDEPPELLLLGDPALLKAYPFAVPHPIVPFQADIYSVSEQVSFPYKAVRERLLHVPHYNIPLMRKPPLVVTVHDLIHLLFMDQLRSALKAQYAKRFFSRVKQQASAIIAVSEATRQDLIAHLDIKPERIHVIYNALSESFSVIDDQIALKQFREKMRLPGEFLLAVGIDKPHKNLRGLIRGMASLWNSGRLDLPLYIAGIAKPDQPALKQFAEALKCRAHLRLLPRLAYEELPMLYQSATALIHPAFYEGFGLPPLEAQAVGTPVAASNLSAIPEVCGDGARYFDPHREEEMQQIILEVIEDEALRAELIDRGRQNVKRFSWIESARQTLNVYRKTMQD